MRLRCVRSIKRRLRKSRAAAREQHQAHGRGGPSTTVLVPSFSENRQRRRVEALRNMSVPPNIIIQRRRQQQQQQGWRISPSSSLSSPIRAAAASANNSIVQEEERATNPPTPPPTIIHVEHGRVPLEEEATRFDGNAMMRSIEDGNIRSVNNNRGTAVAAVSQQEFAAALPMTEGGSDDSISSCTNDASSTTPSTPTPHTLDSQEIPPTITDVHDSHLFLSTFGITRMPSVKSAIIRCTLDRDNLEESIGRRFGVVGGFLSFLVRCCGKEEIYILLDHPLGFQLEENMLEDDTLYFIETIKRAPNRCSSLITLRHDLLLPHPPDSSEGDENADSTTTTTAASTLSGADSSGLSSIDRGGGSSSVDKNEEDSQTVGNEVEEEEHGSSSSLEPAIVRTDDACLANDDADASTLLESYASLSKQLTVEHIEVERLKKDHADLLQVCRNRTMFSQGEASELLHTEMEMAESHNIRIEGIDWLQGLLTDCARRLNSKIVSRVPKRGGRLARIKGTILGLGTSLRPRPRRHCWWRPHQNPQSPAGARVTLSELDTTTTTSQENSESVVAQQDGTLMFSLLNRLLRVPSLYSLLVFGFAMYALYLLHRQGHSIGLASCSESVTESVEGVH